MTTLILRSESKHAERRSALTPSTVKALLEHGYRVEVEHSSDRCYRDDEFEAVGAIMVPEGSWETAPTDYIVVGLKELPEADTPLRHTHIQFGHCYKNQQGWDKYLSRFVRGDGLLYDIEFLTNDDGRRVAAFGYHAGYAGAAVALLAWTHQVAYPHGPPLGPIPVFPTAQHLIDTVQQQLQQLQQQQNTPRVIVIGAHGRCGTGAVNFCQHAGIPDSQIIQWDIAETARGGPFPEINACDIFINCIYLGANPTAQKIPPFVTRESLAIPAATLDSTTRQRQLRVICDVSCDPNSQNNPVPMYSEYSTFENPTLPVQLVPDDNGPPLTMVSIDHLPSLVAREASEDFGRLLLPSLLALDRRHQQGVWTRAEKIFQEKASELPPV